MKCPKDESVLKAQVYEADITVDVCPTCQGMWLDQGELEKIQDVRENDYSKELKCIPNTIANAYEMARQKSLPEKSCAKCNRQMASREYGYCSQIIIDVCPACNGIWLDKDEIEVLEVFFEQARMETKDIRKGFFKSLLAMFRM